MKNILLLIPIFLLLGCDMCNDGMPNSKHYSNVSRVFMHDPGYYSILYTESTNSQELLSESWEHHCSCSSQNKFRIFNDVPDDDLMWADAVKVNTGDHYGWNVEIHIHKDANIEGGNWDHGKFGRGKNNRVN